MMHRHFQNRHRGYTKSAARIAVLAACFWPPIVQAQGAYQQYLENWKHASDPLEQWIFANGQKLAELMPQPVSGLVDHLPWESVDNYLPHFESYVHHQYFGFSVERIWGIDDPQLFQQVMQAQQRLSETKKKIESPQIVQNVQAGAKAQQEANARYLKQYEALRSQGKQKEAQEVLEKRAKDPIFQPPPEFAENKQREEELRDLEGNGRKLILDIQASYPPVNWPALKQVGTLKGHPLFRAGSGDIVLGVYVGPTGFRNLPAGKEPQKMQMKCFLVQAQFPQGDKNEAIARQMLEKVDYERLAKLIEP